MSPELKGYGSPEFQIVRVGSSAVDVGELQLVSRTQSLTGVVSTDSGNYYQMWKFGHGVIKEDGFLILPMWTVNIPFRIPYGKWEVGYDLPMPADGSEPPYIPQPPKRVKMKASDTTKSINFTAKEAGAQITGTVYGPNGGPVSDLNAWVYAREYDADSDDDFYEIVAEVPLTSRGTFSFRVSGEYIVGLWLLPGSGYVNPEEKYYRVDVANGVTTLTDFNQTTQSEASFTLMANDATVSESFILNGVTATGLTGEVAISADGEGWQSTPIEDDGTYSMLLSPGAWTLTTTLNPDSQSRNIPRYPPETVVVTAIKSTTVSQNFVLLPMMHPFQVLLSMRRMVTMSLVQLSTSGQSVKSLIHSLNIGTRLKPMKMGPSPYPYYTRLEPMQSEQFFRKH